MSVRQEREHHYSVSDPLENETFSLELLEAFRSTLQKIDIDLYRDKHISPDGEILEYVRFFDTKLNTFLPLGISPYEKLIGFSPVAQRGNEEHIALLQRDIFSQDKAHEYVFLPFEQQTLARVYACIEKKVLEELRSRQEADNLREELCNFLEEKMSDTPFFLQREETENISLGALRDARSVRTVDASLHYRNERILESSQPRISLSGWNLTGTKEKIHPASTHVYDDVRGVICVGDDMTINEMRHIVSLGKNWLALQGIGSPSSTVLPVNSQLLEIWKKQRNFFSLQKKTSQNGGYVPPESFSIHRKEKPELTLSTYEPNPHSHIGGSHIALREKQGDKERYFLIDWGKNYSRWPWSTIANFPGAHQGIDEFFRRQLMRPMRELYRLDLLMLSLKPEVLEKGLNQISVNDFSYEAVDGFILMELYHRLGEERFVLLCREQCPQYTRDLEHGGKFRGVLKHLSHITKEKYALDREYIGVGITHSDTDHSWLSSVIATEIVRVLSPTTAVSLQQSHEMSSNWMTSQALIHTLYMEPKVGNAYQTTHVPLLKMDPGSREELSPGFFVTALAAQHIPGMICFFVELYFQGKLAASFFHEADAKDPTAVKAAHAHMEKYQVERLDLAVIEGTYLVEDVKYRAVRKESDVRSAFKSAFWDADRKESMVVVDVIKHNLFRACNIITEAVMAGKNVAVSPKILYPLHLMIERYRKKNGLSEERISSLAEDRPEESAFRRSLRDAYESIQSESPRKVSVWQSPSQVTHPYAQYLYRRYGAVNQDAVSLGASDWILIRDFNEPSSHLSGIAAEAITWILSSYGRIDTADTPEMKKKEAFAADHKNILLLRDKAFSASGHGPLYPADHAQADGARLDWLNRINPAGVLIDHTLRRRKAGDILTTYENLGHAKIHGGKHPITVIPIGRG